MVVITVPIIIWGLRLAIYIGRRHNGEDYRYKLMREQWEKCGTCCYYYLSWTFVYSGQSLISFIVNSSVLFVNLYSRTNDLYFTDCIGLFIWLIGFTIEVIADSQLSNHLKNGPAPGSGKFIKTGLWRYSRHPNYFGEAIMWYGLYLIACGIEKGWYTMWSCITMNLIIRFVSGVPFPEKKYKDNEEWQQYCKETNVFCLWFAKTSEMKKTTPDEMPDTAL